MLESVTKEAKESGKQKENHGEVPSGEDDLDINTKMRNTGLWPGFSALQQGAKVSCSIAVPLMEWMVPVSQLELKCEAERSRKPARGTAWGKQRPQALKCLLPLPVHDLAQTSQRLWYTPPPLRGLPRALQPGASSRRAA